MTEKLVSLVGWVHRGKGHWEHRLRNLLIDDREIGKIDARILLMHDYTVIASARHPAETETRPAGHVADIDVHDALASSMDGEPQSARRTIAKRN